MNKCLVTKLNGAVDNSDLLKIGEFRINVTSSPNPSKLTQGMELEFTEPTEVSIVGDGYFTDENLSANYGKVKTITSEMFFISNGNYELSIKNKYKVSVIGTTRVDPVSGVLIGKNKSINLDSLKYSNSLYRIESITVEGDISAFENALGLVYVSLLYTNITGDISAFTNKTELEELYLPNINITGDISAFKNKTKLIGLQLDNTSVYGDISVFRNCPLQEIHIGNVGNLTGDLAKLPAKCYYIFLGNDASKTVFNWTSRDTSEYITAWDGYAKVTNVDDMLIGMARCTVPPNFAAFPIYHKGISIIGTRTSVSDSALTTLQQKGYTVSVTVA